MLDGAASQATTSVHDSAPIDANGNLRTPVPKRLYGQL
jgi:hypothetical protein